MIKGLRPYPAYKDSGVPWLGEIPESWDVRRVKHLFRCKKVPNDGGREQNVLSLTLRGVVNNDPENPEGLVPRDYATYQIFERDDLVFKLIDLENFRTSRVGLVHERGIMSSAYVRLTLTANADIRFFYHQFFDLYTRGIYNQLGAGVRSTLGPGDLLNIDVVAPSIPEQRAIVTFIDHADGLIRRYIRTKQKLIKLLEEEKQGIVHRAVTGGLDPNVHLKPSGVELLGDVPAHWEVKPLKSVAFVQSGLTLGKHYTESTLVEFPYLRVANVQAGHLNLDAVKRVAVSEADAARSMLQHGDVLMTEGGDPDKLGRGCVWENQITPCLHQNHIFAVRPKPSQLQPHFLSALLGAPYAKTYFLRRAKQTTNLASTNKTTIGQFPVLLPSVEEQAKLLEALDAQTAGINQAAVRAEREIGLLREYRTCLIADVVTGKVDVREAAAWLPDQASEAEPLDEIEDLSQDESAADGEKLEAADAA
jgi:type I restriction enzyme S subunit